MKIIENVPFEIKFFTDRSAGFKHISDQTNVDPDTLAFSWNVNEKRVQVAANTPGLGVPAMYRLQEVEIF
jgi:hypothetical protein